jgi:glycosyltransferase involved in cell wall biosynthesis
MKHLVNFIEGKDLQHRGTSYMVKNLIDNILPFTENIQKTNFILLPFFDTPNIQEARSSKNIIWCHVPAHDMPPDLVFFLSDEIIKESTIAYIVQSPFHKENLVENFNLDPNKVFVLNNAFNPIKGEIKKNKKKITFIYTSQNDRGIDILLECFMRIKDKNIELIIHGCECDDCMGKMSILDKNDPRTSFVGYTPKEQYNENLKKSNIYAYPCRFEETACIGVMEAMSAGLKIITTDLGALPDTTGGFAKIISGMPVNNKTLKVKEKEDLIKGFVKEMKKAIKEQRKGKFNFEKQKEYIDNRFTWEKTKQQWIEFDKIIGEKL